MASTTHMSTRIARIEARVGVRRIDGSFGIDNSHAAIGIALLALQPDLRLVEQCDTDLETYANIRLTIAWADGDERAAAKWCDVPPSPRPMPGEQTLAFFRRWAQSTRSYEHMGQLEQQAIENARARLATQREKQR